MGYFKRCANEIVAWLCVDHHLIRYVISNVIALCPLNKRNRAAI